MERTTISNLVAIFLPSAGLTASMLLKSGAKLKSEWLFDKNYNSWFYLKADGTYAEKGWQTIKGKDYHFKLGGYLSTETWIDRSYVTSSGAKAGKGWLFDKNYNSWFYINSDGNYVNKEWLWDNGYYYLQIWWLYGCE